ncbi:MAG: DUF4142 domain-containing protein [Candidatus Thiodiazotropha sp. (ex. Lucinisca nassula)]|nr:DUF4142 domain-containing protein [Candidatus Thiodiazotropha sp. (ex. Lucinisca nassula)]MBW9268722.1 DUF4142 domain-containing protein [Candidatus Thiodiazotropha sp. (ex. Lucinisca nassula)]
MGIKSKRYLLTGLIVSLLATQSTLVQAGKMTDGEIIAVYNQVNTFDIETAGLALKCSKSKEVLSLATMVQNDHTGVRQLAADLAKELGVPKSLPAGRENATAEHAKTLKMLNKKCDDGFDRAYLKYEIDFHTAAIDAVENVLIPAANEQKLKSLMKKILPGFEHHLSETKRVYETM